MSMEMDATIPNHDVTVSKAENAYNHNGPVNMNEHLSRDDEKQVILDDVEPQRCHHCMGNESTFHREIEVNYMALKLDLVNSQSQNDYLVQAKNRADERCQKMELQLRKALMHCSEIDSLHKALQHLQSNARSSALERTELRVHIESLEEQKDHYKNRNKLLERENLKLKAEQEECIRIIVDMRIELERFKGISQSRCRTSISKHRPQEELHASSVSLTNHFNSDAVPETGPEDFEENQEFSAGSVKTPFAKGDNIPNLGDIDLDKSQQDIPVSTDKLKYEHKVTEKNAREALRRWSMVTFGRPLTVLDRCIEENKCYHESFRNIPCIDSMSPNTDENQPVLEEQKQDDEDGNIFPNRVRKILPTRLRRKQSSNAMIGNQSFRNSKKFVGDLDDLNDSLPAPYDEKENKLIEKFLNISKYRHTVTRRKSSKNKIHIGLGSLEHDKKNYEPGYQNL